jgi:hypothetical protein
MNPTFQSSIAIYDGRLYLGHIHENGDGKHQAPLGRMTGSSAPSRTRKEAADAISRTCSSRAECDGSCVSASPLGAALDNLTGGEPPA